MSTRRRDRASKSEDPNLSVSESVKGRRAWTSEEDDKLIQVLREIGLNNWTCVASRMPGRSYKSCRARWFDYLRHHPTDPEGEESAESVSLIDIYDYFINDPKTPAELKEYYEMLKSDLLEKEARNYSFHVMGYPSFEISKLTIDLRHFDFNVDKQPFGIYGHIILVDELGNEFLIFKRDQTNPLTLYSQMFQPHHTFTYNSFATSTHNNKMLVLENFDFRSPRCLPASFRVLINLRDNNRNKFIINEDFNQPIGFCYNGQISLCWSPTVWLDGYIYQSAVHACVDVTVVEGDNNNNNNDNVDDRCHEKKLNVGGEICTNIDVNRVDIVSHKLFSNYETSGKIIKYGEQLVKSGGTAVAVPSHSSLTIQLDLTVGGIQVSDSVNFKANDCGWVDEKVFAGGNICNVVVRVHWFHPFHCLPEIKSYQWKCDHDIVGACDGSDATRWHSSLLDDEPSEYASSSSSRARAVPTSKNYNNIHLLSRFTRQSHPRPVYIQPHLRTLDSQKWLVRCGRGELYETLIEIFSISIYFFPICGRENLSIHGKITGNMEHKEYSVDYFKLEEMELSYESGFGILHPHGPERCHMSSRFAMTFDLKDGGDRDISYGYLAWNESRERHETWINRRLCSVIPGEHGYAALHYMVIKDALVAKLKFTVRSNDGSVVGSGCVIRGFILARYSNYRYATAHDKVYYQSTLFKKSDFVHVGDDGEVPLLRSAVAVPIISSLIVSVTIELLLPDADPTDGIIMSGEATLKPKREVDSRGKAVYFPDEKLVATLRNYSVQVYVEWAGER